MNDKQIIEASKAQIEDALRQTGRLVEVLAVKERILQARATATEEEDGQGALMLAYFDLMLEPDML